MNVLIVEDEVDILDTLCDTLELEFDGVITIHKALNGAEALELYKENTFDLVITDINMPEMNGIELTSNIRKDNEDIPIIVFTGHGDEEEYSKLRDFRVTAMVRKPHIQVLMEAVGKILN